MPMQMNSFEREIAAAICRHHPNLSRALDELVVASRESTAAGSFTRFEPLSKPIESVTQILDLHGTIDLPNGVQLSAHIEMEAGIPQVLEICCLSSDGWDGNYASFQIES